MLEEGIEKMYEQWMHTKWCGFQSKEDTIRLIELSYNWGEFIDELTDTINRMDDH